MTRRNAPCAAVVIASASSNTMSLYPPGEVELEKEMKAMSGWALSHCRSVPDTHPLKTFLVLAKLLTCSLTTSIPLSSDAFNSNTLFFHLS